MAAPGSITIAPYARPPIPPFSPRPCQPDAPPIGDTIPQRVVPDCNLLLDAPAPLQIPPQAQVLFPMPPPPQFGCFLPEARTNLTVREAGAQIANVPRAIENDPCRLRLDLNAALPPFVVDPVGSPPCGSLTSARTSVQEGDPTLGLRAGISILRRSQADLSQHVNFALINGIDAVVAVSVVGPVDDGFIRTLEQPNVQVPITGFSSEVLDGDLSGLTMLLLDTSGRVQFAFPIVDLPVRFVGSTPVYDQVGVDARGSADIADLIFPGRTVIVVRGWGVVHQGTLSDTHDLLRAEIQDVNIDTALLTGAVSPQLQVWATGTPGATPATFSAPVADTFGDRGIEIIESPTAGRRDYPPGTPFRVVDGSTVLIESAFTQRQVLYGQTEQNRRNVYDSGLARSNEIDPDAAWILPVDIGSGRIVWDDSLRLQVKPIERSSGGFISSGLYDCDRVLFENLVGHEIDPFDIKPCTTIQTNLTSGSKAGFGVHQTGGNLGCNANLQLTVPEFVVDPFNNPPCGELSVDATVMPATSAPGYPVPRFDNRRGIAVCGQITSFSVGGHEFQADCSAYNPPEKAPGQENEEQIPEIYQIDCIQGSSANIGGGVLKFGELSFAIFEYNSTGALNGPPESGVFSGIPWGAWVNVGTRGLRVRWIQRENPTLAEQDMQAGDRFTVQVIPQEDLYGCNKRISLALILPRLIYDIGDVTRWAQVLRTNINGSEWEDLFLAPSDPSIPYTAINGQNWENILGVLSESNWTVNIEDSVRSIIEDYNDENGISGGGGGGGGTPIEIIGSPLEDHTHLNPGTGRDGGGVAFAAFAPATFAEAQALGLVV